MAIFHLTAKVHSRAKGHSTVNGAAYQSRDALLDERTGQRHDYSRKSDELLFQGIYAPKDAPAWARDRTQLWNHVETFERRRDAQLARAFDIALPHELSLEQNRQALQDWVRENFMRKGLIADVAIHAPHRHGDQRNVHAHVMVVMRKLDGDEFTAKKDRATIAERKEELEALRQSWERIGNRHLERHGFEPTLDSRSFEDRGIDRLPTVHLGKDTTAIERDGVQTERGNVNRSIQAENERREIDLAASRAKREAEAKQERSEQAPEATSASSREHNAPKPHDTDRGQEADVEFKPKTGLILGGLAKIAETLISFLDWTGGPKLTKEEVRARHENLQAEAEAEAKRTHEAECEERYDAQYKAQQEKLLSLSQRFGTPPTVEANIGRSLDDDLGRERDR